MANLPETPVWSDFIDMILAGQTTRGLPDSPQNQQALQLANRTGWLKQQADSLVAQVDALNGEQVPVSVKDKLDYLENTKSLLSGTITTLGVAVGSSPFRQYPDLIADLSIADREVTNTVNQDWFVPGTSMGGISWTDPGISFDHILIIDTLVAGDTGTSVAPGVQHFTPTAGTHQYKILVVFGAGLQSNGVLLDETTYTVRYTANIISGVIPSANPHYILLTFDNVVSCSSSAGFAIGGFDTESGFTDTLVFVDQPDIRQVRLCLDSKVFLWDGHYTISYDGSGTLLDASGAQVTVFTDWILNNNSTAQSTGYVAGQIPQGDAQSLIAVFSRAVQSIDASKFTLTGAGGITITGVVSPTGTDSSPTVQFSLSGAITPDKTAIRISMAAGGAQATDSQQLEPFANRAVSNNATLTSILPLLAVIPTALSNTLLVVMQGPVSIQSGTSGTGVPIGWSLTDTSKQILSWSISDGTIKFILNGQVPASDFPVISYDGTDATFRASYNNSQVPAFSVQVVNNSDLVDTGYWGTFNWSSDGLLW